MVEQQKIVVPAKRGGYSPVATGPAPTKPPAKSGPPAPLPYNFKKKKRKDLINAMQITVFSMTDAELDKKIRKELEEAVENVVKNHKDAKALAYTVEKG